MSEFGKMQECWVIFRCKHTENVNGIRVQCPVTARRNAFNGPAYHKHGTQKVFMEPIALAITHEEGIAGGAGVTQEATDVVDEAEAIIEDVRYGDGTP